MKKKYKHFWVECITGKIALDLAAKSIFCPVSIIADRRNAGYFAKALSFFFRSQGMRNSLVFKNLFLLNEKNASGKALYYNAMRDLDAAINGFISQKTAEEGARFRNMLKSYCARYLWSKAIFIAKASFEIENLPLEEQSACIVYIRKNHLTYILAQFYRNKGINVREYFYFSQWLKFYLRPLGLICSLIAAKLFPRSEKGRGINTPSGPVWVEYYQSPLHSFWFKLLKEGGIDAVAYLDRPDTPPAPEAAGEIIKNGIKWINCRTLSLFSLYRLSFCGLKKILHSVLSIFLRRPLWLGIFIFEYELLLLVYKSVYSRFGVKVLIQHQESSWKQQAQAEAVFKAGGIMLGYHWSSYNYYLCPTHFFPQHVYFSWGKMMYDCIRKQGSVTAKVLPCGFFLGNGQMPSGRREEVLRPQAEFVISVFDDDLLYRGYHAPDSLSEFYLVILKVLKDNFRLGAVIKSKHFSLADIDSLPQGKNIKEDMAGLAAGNRLLFLEPHASPLTAAFLSDLSVGFCINSACMAAALAAKKPAIQWDALGLLHHPFYRDKAQKIVYAKAQDLAEAILAAASGDRSIGDYSAWRKYADYFGDRLAGKRMAGFIGEFLKLCNDKEAPEAALRHAADKYTRDNNIAEDFFKADNLWEDEQ